MRFPTRRLVVLSIGLLVFSTAFARLASAQSTTTYHLHAASSPNDASYRALDTSGPAPTGTALQSGDLKNQTTGTFITAFETVPTGHGGTIPANSTVTFSVWMKKTANYGVFDATASLSLNGTTFICTPTGPALATTVSQPVQFTCSTGAASITQSTTDFLRLFIGYSIVQSASHSVKVELDIDGSTDSTVIVPNPVPPNISSLSASSGIVGDVVTITGTGFGSAGTVTFNGATASTSSWNNTSIHASVPAAVAPGAGPVVVTVGGTPSPGVSFTVLPHITSLTPSTGPFTQTVTIGGTSFGATQGSSTITFNGAPASATSWSATSIGTSVPSGATTGPVVVTVLGNASTGASFSVLLPAISSLSPTTAVIGQSITISGTHFGAIQGASTVTFNGVLATPTSWGDTSISVAVPPGAATGPVVVTVGGETSNANTLTVITTGTVAGTITKATGGAALSGATVQAVLTGVVQGTATSAADGTYSIGNLKPGAYDIRVLATGYSSEVRSGTAISANVTTTVSVAMLQPGSISGSVTQSDGVTPISGAAVTLYSGPLQASSASTNGTGAYSITNLHPGAYTVRASDAGFSTTEQGASIAENTNTTSNLSLNSAGTGGVSYVYDDLGRLVQVTDPSGNSAIYHYDLVGNLTSIERPGATSVSISDFTPNSGPVGATVTIYGVGFSTTPSSNTVTFGSTATTVTTATATQLTVTAPAAGPIAVSTPNGSGTSQSSFTITTTGPPTITSFSPGTAGSGTALTVNGTNFDTVPANDNLTVNVTPAQVSSATTTALQSTVPASATAGHLSVATVNGSVATSSYLWVAPPPYVAANLDSTGTLPFGTATPVSVAASANSSLVALRVFDGTQGHRASVKVTGATASVYVYLYDAFGHVMQSSALSGDFVDVATLRSTATYSVVVDPQTTNQTSATLTLYDVPADFSSTITPGGSPVTVPITAPGQNGVLTFAGTAGQKVSLLGNGTISGQLFGCDVNVSIFNQDGSVLAPATCMEGSGFIDATILPATGTYTILVDPVSWAIGNLTLSLYTVSDYTNTITAGGAPVTVAISTPGQNGLVTFAGTAGQKVSLVGSNGTIAGQIFGCDVNVSILNPNGSVLAPASCMEGSGFIDATTLPTTGTYTILVDPVTFATGNLTLTLYTVSDYTNTITQGGAPVTVSISTPGQNGLLTFSGTASERVSLNGTNGTIAGQIFGCDVNVSIVRQRDNLVVAAATCMEVSGFIDVTTLPTTDTYVVLVDPVSTATGNLTLTLYDVPADISGTITIGGSQTLTTTTPGQNGTLTFVSGTSGQSVTVHLTNNTMGSVTVTLYDPNGTSMTSTTSSAGAFDLTSQTLTVTGTYTIKIDPAGPNVGSISVNITTP